MSFGHLSPRQKRALELFVARRVVHDLGAGELVLARALLRLKAARVVAVDTYKKNDAIVDTNLTYVCSYFSDFKKPVRTAFVSWPWASPGIGLVELVKDAPTVIYLGSNMDGMACGGSDLWKHLVTRYVLAHEPDRKNTLIVYGKTSPVERAWLPEEMAAFDFKKVHSFRDAYGTAPRGLEREFG